MDDARYFAGLCFGAAISARQVLASKGDDDLGRMCRELSRDELDWVLSFVRRFRGNARRLNFDHVYDLASVEGARRLVAELRTPDTAHSSTHLLREALAAIEMALRMDEWSVSSNNAGAIAQDDFRALLRSVHELKSQNASLIHSVSSVEDLLNRFRVSSGAPHEQGNGATVDHNAIIALLDYVSSLALVDKQNRFDVSPVVATLIPGDPSSRTIYVLRLITEKLLEMLTSLDINIINVEVGRTIVDSRQHHVVEVRDTPPDRDDLAGTIFTVVHHGFRCRDRVIRQPAVVAYKRGARSR